MSFLVVGFTAHSPFRLSVISMHVCYFYHLVGLVVKASAARAEDPGFESRLLRDFSGVESYLKTGIPVATLPGAWRYRVSAWTGWPGVSIL